MGNAIKSLNEVVQKLPLEKQNEVVSFAKKIIAEGKEIFRQSHGLKLGRGIKRIQGTVYFIGFAEKGFRMVG
jgi:hypothetical protein